MVWQPRVALGADSGEPGSLNHLFLPPLLYDKHHLKVQISITPVGYREKRERPEAVETLAHPQLYKGHNACPPGQGWGEKEGLKLLFSVKFAEPKKTLLGMTSGRCVLKNLGFRKGCGLCGQDLTLCLNLRSVCDST